MNTRIIPILAVACLLLAGCHHDTSPPSVTVPLSEHDQAAAANALFLNQKTFDPWVLTTTDQNRTVDPYLSDGRIGSLVRPLGNTGQSYAAGDYKNGQLSAYPPLIMRGRSSDIPFQQALNLQSGQLSTSVGRDQAVSPLPEDKIHLHPADWSRLWQTSDIIINGDPEAQQVTHANLFYLLSSTYPGSDHSIPPFGLSSNLYGGHIFWDAEVWMLPALLVQHPEYAKPIVDYRFKTLSQAKKNAQKHGFGGAEYPWESADTGAEMAPAEFAQERHITADVGWAAWQYYLWTGDKNYLKSEGWPILQATAAYWVSRVAQSADGKFHIKSVLSPDETAGIVDDDAYTNAVVQANLRAATRAAAVIGQTADPRWVAIAGNLLLPFDKALGIPAENSKPMNDRFSAKQADTLLLIHPLNVAFDAQTAGRMLDFYTAHTSKFGPAMTTSIEAVVAARLGRAQPSLNLFHDSYRPFMRGPWDAFAEKRTSSRVYFCTGMGGCLQSVLFGFAGLLVAEAGQRGRGTKIAGGEEASLYADPHLPAGWGGLTVKGVKFQGHSFDVAITAGNKVTVTPK